jgi:predicted pyridoxine 5'-phosphate oxidase superfamily flavin-nucleotide-binding protein
MSQNFTNYAFTDSVKKAQEQFGSRATYANVENRLPDQSHIYQREMAHISKLDGFYMATVNEDGWPYVQFRGGPKGFLKIIDQQTLGYADFKGNMQYISTGNINSTKKTSLILMHYPTRTRLKIWAETEILNPEEHPELKEKLVDDEYKAKVERLVLFHILAFDWNCPQHIPQRYTIEEFKDEVLPNNPEILEDCCP